MSDPAAKTKARTRPRTRQWGLRSVKARLFVGFLAMTLLIAGVGGYALYSIKGASDVVEDTFDRPLMAVNFARSASQGFSALEIAVLMPGHYDEADIASLEDRFLSDLSVARERSIEPRAEDFFVEVEQDYALWKTALASEGGTGVEESRELSTRIEESLDIIVELQTNESFRNRESAIATMTRTERLSLYAVGLALALTLALSVWLTVTIVRPLKAAALAATKISGGRFNVTIPAGGDDETGQLLRAMREMQDNIRSRMVQEQDARQLAQQRLSDSLENSKDAVLLTDRTGRVTVANPRVAELLGGSLPDGDVIGLQCQDILTHDGQPTQVAEPCIVEGREFRLPGGRWLRVNASDTGEGGRLYIWTDISEARERAEHLARARDDAEAASRAKTLFLAAMSHELNTPLNAVIGLSDVLRLQMTQSPDFAPQADLVSLIMQNGEQISHILKDVLEIADGDTGSADLQSLPIADLRDVIGPVVEKAGPLAGVKSVRLIWAPPTEACPVLGEAEELSRIIANLIDNGVKFNRSGGVVKVRLTHAGNGGVRLDIADTGLGIAAPDHARILEPFVQLDEGYSRSVDGTGLGLTVANQILKRLHARLLIHSKPGTGSVFSIVFPAVSKAPTASNPQDTQRHAA